MSSFAISPRAVHAVGSDIADQSTQLEQAAQQTAATVVPGGDGFQTTEALALVRTVWQVALKAEAAQLGTLAEAVHQSAAVMETTEVDATAAADALLG